MIPESSNSLPCYSIIVETAVKVIEHLELLSRHHICRRLGLDTTPDIPDGPFKRLGNGWRDLSVLVRFGHIESACHRQLIGSLATHSAMRKSSKPDCSDRGILAWLAKRDEYVGKLAGETGRRSIYELKDKAKTKGWI